MTETKSIRAWISSRIILSFMSALAGWGAGVVLVMLLSVPYIFSKQIGGANPFTLALIACVFMSAFVLASWIILLVPVSLLIPSHAVFWRPATLTLIGGVIGPIIITVFTLWEQLGADVQYPSLTGRLLYYLSGVIVWGIPAAIVGSVSGFVAAILNRHSLPPSRHSGPNL